jgi:hypothetical protein
MASSGACENVSEIKVTWAHVMNDGAVAKMRDGRQKQQYPEFDTLRQSLVTQDPAMDDVLIRAPDAETCAEMRQWLEENAKRKYKMFGRFGWTDNFVSIERMFVGLMFKFTCPNAAFFFKMRFYAGC